MKLRIAIAAALALAASAAQAQRIDAPDHWRFKECYSAMLRWDAPGAARHSWQARLAAARLACGPGDYITNGGTTTVR